MMDRVLDWLRAQGLGWEALITLGLLAYDLGRRLAERDGVAPDVLARREAEANARLARDADELLAEMSAMVR